MTTNALLMLQELLVNKLIHGFMVDHNGQNALFSLTPIWDNSRACTLRIISLRYNVKAKGFTLIISCPERPSRINDSNELAFKLDDPIRFV